MSRNPFTDNAPLNPPLEPRFDEELARFPGEGSSQPAGGSRA